MRTTGKIAGVNISDIAAKTGTPVIIYDEDMMRNQIRTYTCLLYTSDAADEL